MEEDEVDNAGDVFDMMRSVGKRCANTELLSYFTMGVIYPFSEDYVKGTRRVPFNFAPTAVNSISFGPPHVRCTPHGAHVW